MIKDSSAVVTASMDDLLLTQQNADSAARKLTITPYHEQDAPALRTMLAGEGVWKKDMRFEDGATEVLCYTFEQRKNRYVLGFYTIESIPPGNGNFASMPHLRHFCVRRAARPLPATWALVRAVKLSVLLKFGSPRLVIHAKDARLMRFIHAAFRARPYGMSEDGAVLYEAEV